MANLKLRRLSEFRIQAGMDLSRSQGKISWNGSICSKARIKKCAGDGSRSRFRSQNNPAVDLASLAVRCRIFEPEASWKGRSTQAEPLEIETLPWRWGPHALLSSCARVWL